MFIDASVMNETAKSQFNMSKLDHAIQSINKEIIDYANRGLTEKYYEEKENDCGDKTNT